jgi:EAL domain-containing protein (putative c-di-GMP-specific phosphodiesterase class I)/GGDEF domain-containing protein
MAWIPGPSGSTLANISFEKCIVSNPIRTGEVSSALVRHLHDALVDAGANGERVALLVVEAERLQRLDHAAGVELATEFCRRLTRILRKGDQLHREGNRRFLIVIRSIKNEAHAMLAASKVRRIGQESFVVGQHSLKLEPLVGIAMFPSHASGADQLLRLADLAVLSARDVGSPVMIYSQEISQSFVALLHMESELDRALDEGELEVYFQPKLDLRTLLPCGAEALIRWNHPERGVLAPGAFLSVAEQTGQLERITWYVLDAAQRLRREWPARCPSLSVSVNIPPCLLDGDNLPNYLADSIGIWGTSPGDLILEITEESAFSRPEHSFILLEKLQQAGVRVSIDDFGTGYSSLSQFKHLPADELKIDQSFVRGLSNDDDNVHIVKMLVNLAKRFGYKVVAEGVEDRETLEMLIEMDCDIAQGYYISRPIPQGKFLQWLSEYTPRPAVSNVLAGRLNGKAALGSDLG